MRAVQEKVCQHRTMGCDWNPVKLTGCRKVKCDKLSPCSSCRTSGFICKPVQRSRLPRGRTGKIKKRNISLEDKVLRLEQLLEAVEKQVYDDGAPVDQGTSSSEHVSNHTRRVHTANKVENLVARDFWIALSNEVSLLAAGLNTLLLCRRTSTCDSVVMEG